MPTDDGRLVVVASRGGAPEHPNWYRNLVVHPQVEVQLKDEVFVASAHTAHGDERVRLWKIMTTIWPAYDAYQERTAREIPVLVLQRAAIE
jgi:deazaflavin-dependent oxidoreductase (nitroreductase family)